MSYWEFCICPNCGEENARRIIALEFGGTVREVLWCSSCGKEVPDAAHAPQEKES